MCKYRGLLALLLVIKQNSSQTKILSLIDDSTQTMPENYATKSRFYGSTFSLEHRKAAPFPAALHGQETEACFIVKDRKGWRSDNFDDEPQRRSAAGMLTRHEAGGRSFGHTLWIDVVDINLRAPLPSICIVAGMTNRRSFPRRARLEGGEPYQ